MGQLMGTGGVCIIHGTGVTKDIKNKLEISGLYYADFGSAWEYVDNKNQL